jgi:hypothetical protein
MLLARKGLVIEHLRLAGDARTSRAPQCETGVRKEVYDAEWSQLRIACGRSDMKSGLIRDLVGT